MGGVSQSKKKLVTKLISYVKAQTVGAYEESLPWYVPEDLPTVDVELVSLVRFGIPRCWIWTPILI
jgi:hypothetical protein